VPSYSPVFSSQFIVSTEAEGYPSFLVPAGFTAVVRDFSIFSTASVELAQLFIQNSDAAPAVCCASLATASAPAYAQWQGRVVCPEGGTISVTLEFVFGAPDLYVGGYLLRNTLS
jgi:hypothetical protein